MKTIHYNVSVFIVDDLISTLSPTLRCS